MGAIQRWIGRDAKEEPQTLEERKRVRAEVRERLNRQRARILALDATIEATTQVRVRSKKK